MIRERHQQISDLLADALEQPRDERPAFLDQACADDSDLRREVESLIASFDQADEFIETPAFALADATATPMIGKRIGAWRILREIGHGGMGTVYLAERADGQYREQAALKIVRRGMDTEFVLRRFRHERQILASLHHPNIARLLDGGTTEDGRPYFVMEHIEGRPIDEYCDERKLSIIERLRLFRTVCAAAHYAHQNLVIHRDIKPANILITAPEGKEGGAPELPKLLDFGIAKILNPEISQTVEKTMTAMRLMTPEYASPEQVRGETVTTASDVYSLGVVLYELLTGHRPYRLSTILPSEIERVICEQEPARPSTVVTRVEEVFSADGQPRKVTPEMVSSTREGHPDKLRRKLAGDLDNMMLMALRKEPARRYASVEHFSEDIRRYLEGLPVTARKDTFGYRADKFVRRNKAVVAAAALIVLSLVAGLIATVWQARRAQSAQAGAERRFNEVWKLSNSYLFELHDAIKDLPGTTKARALIVQRALESLNSLAKEAASDPALQQDLAAAYLKVGDVQGRPGHANLGDRTGALASYRQALAIRQALVAQGRQDEAARQETATLQLRIGDVLQQNGDSAGALNSYREALVTAEKPQPQLRQVASSLQRIAEMMARTGDPAGGLRKQQQAVLLVERLGSDSPHDPDAQRELFISYIKLGNLLAATGDKTGALQRYRQALPIAEAVARAKSPNVQAQRELAAAHDRVGNLLGATGQTEDALVSYRAALRIREPLAEADPNNVESQRDLSISYDKLGGMLTKLGDIEGALASYRRALAIDTPLAEKDPGNLVARLDCANSQEKIGDLLAKKGDLKAALDSHLQAMKVRATAFEADKDDIDIGRDLAASYARLGGIRALMAANGPVVAARPLWQEARQWYQRSLEEYLKLQKRGALVGEDAAEPERLAREIAKYDKQFKQR
ncbi:MAG: protein kinase domain-containing protein [Blastocatellia bacterium]